MPRLHYSNQLESLIVPLAHELDKRDPFERVDIVVPNYSLEKWISLKIAQTNGIAANLRFITLEKAILEVIRGTININNYDLLKKETIQCLLLEILREKIKNPDPLWIPLRNYLSPKITINSQASEFRLIQLSNRLTHLFQEYEFSRNEELINSWILRKNAINLDPLGAESWQKELWNELFGPKGKVTKNNLKARQSVEEKFRPELYTLTQLYRICENTLNEEKSKRLNNNNHLKALHIFGVSYLSQFHLKALTEQLSKLRDINVYSLNPCMEFWEDVQSLSESKAEFLRTIESKKVRFTGEKTLSEKELFIGEELQHEDDNPFLQAWGRPGRENIRLLNQWSNWDFTPWFVENDTINQGGNLLNQLQKDILFREPRRAKSLEMEQDDSIIVLACPNPRREVEAVASLIWDLIRRDPDLKLNECAVIANNMERYQHDIEQVFEENYNLPYHLIDGFSGIAGRLEEAANILLGLCYTEYTRKDLFSLINNPFFIENFEENSVADNFTRGEPLHIEKWMQWSDELNIFYGVDKEWNEEHGYNHLENDNYSWEQAFHRLTIGDMLSSKTDIDTISIANKKIVPADIDQEWSVEAARFILIVRSLIADTRHLPKWRMTAKDWSIYLKILIKTYLIPSGAANEEAFQNLLRNTDAISGLDLGQEKGHLFKFKTIIEFFKQKQSSVRMHRGHYLAEGITVSSFKPMRPIPFKVVFLLGLGEGLFPSSFRKDTLDLRHIPEKLDPPIEGKNFRERHIGDVSETERDRYMFLETLISTRKNLVLSYVSQSDKTDDKLDPSSIIQTLLDELNRGYLKNKFKETLHPLKPYSLSYFPELKNTDLKESKSIIKLPNYNFSAFRQARSLRLRELFDHQFPGMERIPYELLSPKIKNFFKNNLIPTKNLLPIKEKNDTEFSISILRKFLESPIQTTVSRIIWFNEEKEDIFTKANEPFLLDRLNEWSLLRKIWDISLRTPIKNGFKLEDTPDWNKLYRTYSQRLELESLMPSSVFKEAMQHKHLGILKNWEKQITGSLNVNWSTLKNNLYRFHFGPVKEGFFNSGKQDNHVLIPAIYIKNDKITHPELDNCSIKIKGSTEWCYTDKQKNWCIIYLSEKESKEKAWLRHFLDVLLLKIAGVLPSNAKVTGICIAPEGKIKLKEINIPSKKQTQEYILSLVQDINKGDTSEFLPIESVLELSKYNLDETNYNKRYYNWIEDKLNSPKENLDISSKFGPVDFIEDFILPDNPYQIMNKRFELFFKTILN